MLKMMLHFIFTESRPILLLYFAYRSYLQDLIMYEMTHGLLTWNNTVIQYVSNQTQSNDDLGDYMDCLRDDVEDSLLNFNATYETKCAVIPDTMHKVDLVMHALALAIMTLFLVVLICLVLSSGARSFGEGRYISFTVGVRKTRSFKLMAVVETVFLAFVVGRNCRTLYLEFQQGHHHKVVEFLESYGTDALVLLYSAYKLFQSMEPSFAWDSDEFKGLYFDRGWSAVFGETNDDFCIALELALYKASYNVTSDLEAMRDKDRTTLRSLLQVCAPIAEGDFEMVGYVQGPDGSFAKLPVDSRQVTHPQQAPYSSRTDEDSEDGSEGLLC